MNDPNKIIKDIRNNKVLLANRILEYVKSQRKNIKTVYHLMIESMTRLHESIYNDFFNEYEPILIAKFNAVPITQCPNTDQIILFDFNKEHFIFASTLEKVTNKYIIDAFEDDPLGFDFAIKIKDLLEIISQPKNFDLVSEEEMNDIYRMAKFDDRDIRKYLMLV